MFLRRRAQHLFFATGSDIESVTTAVMGSMIEMRVVLEGNSTRRLYVARCVCAAQSSPIRREGGGGGVRLDEDVQNNEHNHSADQHPVQADAVRITAVRC